MLIIVHIIIRGIAMIDVFDRPFCTDEYIQHLIGTMICWLFIAAFCFVYQLYRIRSGINHSKLSLMKKASLGAMLAAIVMCALSIYKVVIAPSMGMLVVLSCICEVMVWITLTLFFYRFWRSHNKHRHSSR